MWDTTKQPLPPQPQMKQQYPPQMQPPPMQPPPMQPPPMQPPYPPQMQQPYPPPPPIQVQVYNIPASAVPQYPAVQPVQQNDGWWRRNHKNKPQSNSVGTGMYFTQIKKKKSEKIY